MGRHGGGAFSGKDPTKVDRSACYMARYIAKNIVAAGLATRAEVQLAYAIGVADPVSVMVDTFGTGNLSSAELTELVRANFPLTPKGIIDHLRLLPPDLQEDCRVRPLRPHWATRSPGKRRTRRKSCGTPRGRPSPSAARHFPVACALADVSSCWRRRAAWPGVTFMDYGCRERRSSPLW
jgi:hypothetical protein